MANPIIKRECMRSDTSDDEASQTSRSSDASEVPVSRTFLANEIGILASVYKKMAENRVNLDAMLVSLEVKARDKEAKMCELEIKLAQSEQEKTQLMNENWSLREQVDGYCTEIRRLTILLDEIEETISKKRRSV